MKKIIIALMLVSKTYAGFESSTLVQVYKNFYKSIESLSETSLLTGYKHNFEETSSFIIGKKAHMSGLVVKIYFKSKVITCGLSQLLYCHNRKTWLKAEEFSVYDTLSTADGKPIKIKRVTILKKPCILHTLHCTAPYTYAITSYNILVHNEYINQEFVTTLINVLNNNQTIQLSGMQGALVLLATKLVECAGAQSIFASIPVIGWIAAALASSYYLYYWVSYHVVPAMQLWWCPKRKRFFMVGCSDACCAQAMTMDNLIAHTDNCWNLPDKHRADFEHLTFCS